MKWQTTTEECGLPPIGVAVLLATKDSKVIIGRFCDNYGQKYWLNLAHDDIDFEGVVAWMPLPSHPNFEYKKWVKDIEYYRTPPGKDMIERDEGEIRIISKLLDYLEKLKEDEK